MATDFVSPSSAESKDDVFDEQFHLPVYNNNKIQNNNIVQMKAKKHRPAPPQHTHNITESPSNDITKTNGSDHHIHNERTLTFTHSSYKSNTTIITDPTVNMNNITPNQWRYIKHKMDDIVPFIQAMQNNELSDTNTQNKDKSILLQKHDSLEEEEEEENITENITENIINIESDHSDHSSDDDVLNDDIDITNITNISPTNKPQLIENQ
eukprot:826517_1